MKGEQQSAGIADVQRISQLQKEMFDSLSKAIQEQSSSVCTLIKKQLTDQQGELDKALKVYQQDVQA